MNFDTKTRYILTTIAQQLSRLQEQQKVALDHILDLLKSLTDETAAPAKPAQKSSKRATQKASPRSLKILPYDTERAARIVTELLDARVMANGLAMVSLERKLGMPHSTLQGILRRMKPRLPFLVRNVTGMRTLQVTNEEAARAWLREVGAATSPTDATPSPTTPSEEKRAETASNPSASLYAVK